jgi:hypothetical protein
LILRLPGKSGFDYCKIGVMVAGRSPSMKERMNTGCTPPHPTLPGGGERRAVWAERARKRDAIIKFNRPGRYWGDKAFRKMLSGYCAPASLDGAFERLAIQTLRYT